MSFTNHDSAVMYDDNGLPVYGMDLELKAKQAAKYDAQKEADVRAWIEAVTGEKFKSSDFHESLKDGALLCKLANKIQPNSCKINTQKMAFFQMENINSFLAAIEKFGVKKHDSFVTVDLYEKKNINTVIDTLFILGSVCQKLPYYRGPVIGVKLADQKKIEFSEQQLRNAANETSLLSVASKKIDQGKSIRHEVVKTKDVGDTSVVNQLAVASNKIDQGKSISREVVKTKNVGDVHTPSFQSQGSVKVAQQQSIKHEVVKVQPSSAPSSGGSDQGFDEIQKLHDLYQKGILTKDEFDAKKKQILGL